MTNLLASGHQSLNIIRRDLEELFSEFTVPRRMLREVERVFDQAPSAIWLWREMDQILEAFMTPMMLRRRIERVFDRVLSSRGFGMQSQGFGSPFISSPWRGEVNSFHAQSGGFGSFNNGMNTFHPGMNTFHPGMNTFHSGMNTFTNGMNTLNTPFGVSSRGFSGEEFMPPLELVETQSELLVRVDLPGVRDTDVETRITDDHILIIRGERRDFTGARNIGFGNVSSFGRPQTEYSEQSYGVFTRTVPLPRNINATHIQAFFRDGVLEVRIPKFETIGTSFNTSFNTFNVRNNNRRVPIGRDESRVGFGSSFGGFGTTSWNGEQRPHVN